MNSNLNFQILSGKPCSKKLNIFKNTPVSVHNTRCAMTSQDSEERVRWWRSSYLFIAGFRQLFLICGVRHFKKLPIHVQCTVGIYTRMGLKTEVVFFFKNFEGGRVHLGQFDLPEDNMGVSSTSRWVARESIQSLRGSIGGTSTP